ncbi:N-6 DNA Methylase [compost metagenome]
MNKTALKNFATNARKELIEKVKARAFKIGITEESIKNAQFESSDAIYIDGKQLSATEKKQREKLISRIREIGYQQVVEEVAYTWFNRFTALRFMEVNNYLPTKVRVLSSSNPNSSEPDIIKDALTVDLDIDKELVYDLKVNNKTEELFKYMVIKQCNSLNKILPFMFETIDDYKEILFPEGLLAKESFIREMTDITIISESDWEQVEIIGWLYQFYISEKKDQVFADLKKNIKINKENIPAATQLFTPHWIVRYMVENSLGRIWLESYPESTLRSEWKYYIEEANQEEEVKKGLDKNRIKNVNPEEITFLDPCCGSGHILVYAFDVLYELYLENGYVDQEIPKLILEKNLYGIDIDDRATQLASFAVMMRAREKSRRVFGQEIKLNICTISESNWMTNEILELLVDKKSSFVDQANQKDTIRYIWDTFKDAKEIGSILDIKKLDLSFIDRLLEEFKDDTHQGDIIERITKSEILEKLPSILLQTRILGNKYSVVCTNPPYMGNKGMSPKLSEYVKKKFPNSKTDMFSVFIEKCRGLTKQDNYYSLITQPSLLFLSSFEKLRKSIVLEQSILNLLHMGRGIFGIDFGSTAFVIRNNYEKKYKGCYFRLHERTFQYIESDDIEKLFLFSKKDHNYKFNFSNYVAKEKLDESANEEKKEIANKELQLYFENYQDDFLKIPGVPVAYWLSRKVIDIFEQENNIGDYSETRLGMATADNNKFLRYWYEVSNSKIGFDFVDREQALNSKLKWFPYNKGGDFRKWFGNNEYVVNWENDGYEIRNFKDHKTNKIRSHNYNLDFIFKEGITWSFVSSTSFGVRYSTNGFLFDVGGSSLFTDDKYIWYLVAYLNSKIAIYLLESLNPSMNFQPGNISSLPLIIMNNEKIVETIQTLAKENIDIAKMEWDSYETSWGFTNHPLIEHKMNTFTIKDAFKNWDSYTKNRFYRLKKNEEDINRMLINLYGLQDEVSPELDEMNITLKVANEVLDIKSFISYSVGCMFGRYSLDVSGIAFAGGNLEMEKYSRYPLDKSNILSILPESYFDNDILSIFTYFVKITFGEETLFENLEFIGDALGKKEGETTKETLRRYFLNDFFKDHVQTYKKKPIYWLFTSGKQKAFNCLIYMHRYDKSTLSRIRTDYLHELQIRMDAEKKTLLDVINGNGTTKEIANAKKELKSLDLKIEELRAYDEKLHHMADMQIEINLDDGVAVNYAKFAGLLAPIK